MAIEGIGAGVIDGVLTESECTTFRSRKLARSADARTLILCFLEPQPCVPLRRLFKTTVSGSGADGKLDAYRMNQGVGRDALADSQSMSPCRSEYRRENESGVARHLRSSICRRTSLGSLSGSGTVPRSRGLDGGESPLCVHLATDRSRAAPVRAPVPEILRAMERFFIELSNMRLQLAEGLITTIEVSIAAIIAGTALGLFVGVGLAFGTRPVRGRCALMSTSFAARQYSFSSSPPSTYSLPLAFTSRPPVRVSLRFRFSAGHISAKSFAAPWRPSP